MRERASGGGAAIFLSGEAREEFASGEAASEFPACHISYGFACRPLLSLLMNQLNKPIRERSVTWNLRLFTHETVRMHATRRK